MDGWARKVGWACTTGARNVRQLLAREAVSDSFSPMKVEKKSDGVTEIDDVLLIETQGETAQALAIRLARPVVVVDKMAGKVVTIAAAAVNPDSATRKAIYYLQQQGKTVLQIADYREC